MVWDTSSIALTFFIAIIVGHQTNRKSEMATKSVNAKSKRIDARVPLHIVDAMDKVKEEGESTGQFVTAALEGEIKRRQRRKAKEQE